MTLEDLPDDEEIDEWPAEQCFQFLQECGLPWPEGENDDWDTMDYQEAVMKACAKLDRRFRAQRAQEKCD